MRAERTLDDKQHCQEDNTGEEFGLWDHHEGAVSSKVKVSFKSEKLRVGFFLKGNGISPCRENLYP